jgi:hypothetical protein
MPCSEWKHQRTLLNPHASFLPHRPGQVTTPEHPGGQPALQAEETRSIESNASGESQFPGENRDRGNDVSAHISTSSDGCAHAHSGA